MGKTFLNCHKCIADVILTDIVVVNDYDHCITDVLIVCVHIAMV